ncbi:MAG: molybdopterin-containing oxidoreductase catalytic subunit [Planctomycetes bacterium]|nr:molybdopterin-containing oxidoreductase catalytic subunit [Planctomycetota bacterium]
MTPIVRRTTCNRDCPDACGILASVAENVVTGLRGDSSHPVTRGFLCFRTSRYPELLAAKERLTHPLVRRGGQLLRASWDEALGLVAGQLLRIRAESGPAAIFHYRSGGSLGILKQLADLFFDQFGPCTGKVGDICSGAGEAAQLLDFGVSDSNALHDLHHSRQIVLWGKNPMVSNVHLLPILKEARARGARLILIDPVHHKTANHVDHVIRVAPGGDFALAMGVARRLFETGRIDPNAANFCDGLPEFRALTMHQTVDQWAAAAGATGPHLQLLADSFADGPTAIQVGWGMQRRLHGGATVRALDALCAISGNLFRPGGGCSFYFKRRKAFSAFAPEALHPRVLREPLLGNDLMSAQDPPVRLVWITAGNPVAMLPGSAQVAAALLRTELVVVADSFLSDTTRRAHVVLPVPTMLEDDDLLGAYGHHWLGESRPVVVMPPEVRHEVHIFQELARRVGLATFPQVSIDDLKRAALAKVTGLGASLDDLRENGGTIASPVSGPLLFPDGKVATENGKVQLLTKAPVPIATAAPGLMPGDSAPLWLFSNSTEKSQASVWSGKGLGEHVWIAVHPEAVPGIADGALVEVVSPAGTLIAQLRHDVEQRRDVAIMPKGGHFDRGHSANSLITARATDLGLGAAYLDCLIRIRPR